MPSKSDEVRIKSQQLRAAQQRKENRTRYTIYAVVGALVLATIAAVLWVIPWGGKSEEAKPSKTSDVIEVTSFVVSADGVGKVKEGSVEVTEYFDYSCHACADVDGIVKDKLQEGIDSGKITMRYVPVDVVDMAWHKVAANASKIVYKEDPAHFTAFHHALLSYFSEQYSQGKAEVVTNAENSAKMVSEIATKAGVPESVVSKFAKSEAASWLEYNTNYWKDLKLEGRDKIATPEFSVKDKSVRLKQEDVNDPVGRFLNEAK